MQRTTILGVAGLLLAALAILAWQLGPRPGTGDAKAAPQQRAAQAVSVTTAVAEQRDVPLELGATGTVSALNRVEIRPQVSAAIAQVHIREGQAVRAGELLFTLDSRAAEVKVRQAEAQLAQNLATLADAERQLARSRDLLRQEFVSQSAVDTNLAKVEEQRGVVAAMRAAIQAARVELGYARITAPSAGRAGAIGVYPGSYVTPTTALVTITQLDPIAVSFSLPQRHLADVLAQLKAGTGRVNARLPGAAKPLTGKLAFVDSAVDAGSGTVQVKAQFDNADQALWPGAYVNVELAVRTLDDAITIPQAAVIQGEPRSAYVVGADGKVQQRRLELLASAGELAVVQGVKAGERVVVEGKQNLRPGSSVREAQAPTPNPAAQASAASPERQR